MTCGNPVGAMWVEPTSTCVRRSGWSASCGTESAFHEASSATRLTSVAGRLSATAPSRIHRRGRCAITFSLTQTPLV